jgi:thiaminase/transcriptional activator TenA
MLPLPQEQTTATVPHGLTARLRDAAQPLWDRQREHPFVVALGAGTLPRENFEFYIRQDARFLDDLTKVFAYAVTRSREHEDMEQFGRLLLNTLVVERALHSQYAQRFGLTPEQMAATPMAPANYAYTRHLLSIAATGTLPQIVTATLPCALIYAEVGRHLVGDTLPAPQHPYAEWLGTYASPEFDAVGRWLSNWLDAREHTLRREEAEHLQHIFVTSTRYEWLFWQMAWTREEWPR